MIKEEFYTPKRWSNWIAKVKESNFQLPQSEQDATGAVFVYIMDDVVLSCLKVLARLEKKLITKEEAAQSIMGIRDIIDGQHESLGEDADMMMDSLRTSLTAVFEACLTSISSEYDAKTPLPKLLTKAQEAETDGRLEEALDLIGQMGARIIAGEALPEVPEMDYCMVAELLDGLDAIAAAQLGDDDYKDEDGGDVEI